MPDSKIRQILDAVTAEVAKCSPLAASGQLLKAWYDVLDTPAAFTYLAGESKEMHPTQSVESEATIGVYCVTAAKDDPSGQNIPARGFLELYRQIVLNVEDDPSLGIAGVQLAMVTGVIPANTSEAIAQGKHVADVLVSVRYRHVRGTP